MHVLVETLPNPLQSVLKGLDYHKKDIEVKHVETVNLGNSGSGDGTRAFTTIYALGTNEYKTVQGSWGGVNMFNQDNLVDTDNTDYPLLPGMLVIKGVHWTNPTMATIYASRDNSILPLTNGDETDKDMLNLLYCFKCIKAGEYRKDELRRRKVTKATFQAAQDNGYIKVNAAGSAQITTSGKNALGSYRGY